MGIHRLNHAVLYVSDVVRSRDFYCTVLGFRRIPGTESMPGAALLRAPDSTNDHDLGLFQVDEPHVTTTATSPGPDIGLYHLGWEVDTLADLRGMAERLTSVGALVGASDHSGSKSLYGKDPDGIEFEIEWLVPADLIDDELNRNRRFIRPLDLEREIDRYGADRHGGVGLSRPSTGTAATSPSDTTSPLTGASS